MRNEVFWRWLKTVAVLLVMMNSGMPLGLFGTTLPDIAILTSATNGQVATTLTWVGLASIVGTVCAGPLFDSRFDGLLLLSIGLLLQGLAIGAVPWCRILIVFQVMTGVASIFSTATMAGSLCVNSTIWRNKSKMMNPIVQLTTLAFILGTAITPQLIAPFIGTHQSPDINASTANPNGSNASWFLLENAHELFGLTTTNVTSRYEGPEPVQIAFVVVACINLLTAVFAFAICALDHVRTRNKMDENSENQRIIRRGSFDSLNETERTLVEEEFVENTRPRERTRSLDRQVLQNKFEENRMKTGERMKQPDKYKLSVKRHHAAELFRTRNEEDAIEEGRTEICPAADHSITGSSVPPVTCNRRIIPLVIIVLFFFVITGCTDAMFGGLLYTFLTSYLHWTPKDGTLLVTVYQAGGLAALAVVVLLAGILHPTVLIVMDIFFLATSSTIIFVTMNSSPTYTWIAVILAGLAASNVQPTALTFARRCFQVNGKMIGMFIGATFLGFAAVSPIAGFLLESYGAVCFPAVLLSITVLEIVIFVLWVTVSRVTVRCDQNESPAEDIVIETERTPLITHQLR